MSVQVQGMPGDNNLLGFRKSPFLNLDVFLMNVVV